MGISNLNLHSILLIMTLHRGQIIESQPFGHVNNERVIDFFEKLDHSNVIRSLSLDSNNNGTLDFTQQNQKPATLEEPILFRLSPYR